MRYTLQAVGYAGGFTRWDVDTKQEFEQLLPGALEGKGLAVKSVQVQADEWDVTSRVFSNQFHYRATVVVESNQPAAVVAALVKSAITGLTDMACTVANLSSGDASLHLPDSNPIPDIATGLAFPLALIAVVVVAVAVIVFKVEA